jgi:hypothetical protein
MYIVDLTDVVSQATSLDAVLKETSSLWSSVYDRMNDSEVLWVIVPNDFRDGQMWPVAMAIADDAREESNLVLKNNITVHQWEDRGADMESAYDEILFFVKNKGKYRFEKDRIRVAHVYEGHEWGGERKKGNSAYHDRKVSRYNENGKDPGNVWLNEDRTQTDNQEVDETRPIPLEEAVRRCVLAGSDEGETVYLIGGHSGLVETVTGEDREVEELAHENLAGEVTN